MKRWVRLFYYLMINVAVSACTVLAVLTLWDRTHGVPVVTMPPPDAVATPVQPGVQTTAQPAPSASGVEPTLPPISLPSAPPWLEYQVQSGDTLAVIAARFDTSVEELVRLNSLANPNVLEVGQVLLIPTEPPPPSATPQPSATPGDPPTPLPTLPLAGQATPIPPDVQVLVEIVTIVGAGVLQDERVILRYNGDAPLRLEGWQLENAGGEAYIFPQFTLYTGGAITVYTRAGTDSVVELYWGRQEPAWQPGDIALLRDPQGNVRVSAQAP